ncbi:hypothetical protein SADUNF_Sadunf06G0175300 [Salix dunnii]|uniref:Uncharacterized protein n=1 Tax=Salix dunnii TaxID=1413687 RepID=A0A835K0S0_9ROSI|nr:hypothetical protein SADUNF_Sadunf06G0175300 [Salix dunnii]
MGRSPKGGIIRGTWTATEDKILTEYVRNHGERNWAKVPKETGKFNFTSSTDYQKQPRRGNGVTKKQTRKTSAALDKVAPCTDSSLPSPPVLTENKEADQILTASSIEGGALEKYLIENSNLNDELLLFTNDNDAPCNFLMDLGMEQMSFSDFLQTDFFSNSNNMHVNGPTPSYPDEASFSPEALLQNWICENGFELELAMGP